MTNHPNRSGRIALGIALLAVTLAAAAQQDVKLSGYLSNETAYTFGGENHWSKSRNTLNLAATGSFSESISWKASGWLRWDPVVQHSDFYPDKVQDDRGFEGLVRETFLDVSLGDWDLRLGRQNIVWGEMVGLFFADVVSARDMREFVLADFEQLRIPQWAARAEYFKDDFHAELVWIPYLTYDNIGEPGDDFYPYPPAFPGLGYRILDEKKPRGGDSDDAAGVRLGWIVDGWDINGYYYRSTDVQPAFQRSFGLVGGVPTLTYTPTHNRIQQWGLTVGKDIGDGLVFKAEAIYTMGRRYDVLRLSDADGLVRKDTLDYVLGLDWTPDASNRLNLQFFQRFYQDHDPDMVPESVESGVSLFYSTKVWGDRLEPEITLIESLNRGDWLLRPRLTWNVSADLKASVGADILNGPPDALFGRFTNGDRVYAEVRYDF